MNSLYERIATDVMRSLQKELPPWRKPWRATRQRGLPTLPMNAYKRTAYRGINSVWLWSRGDEDMRYVTYRQALLLGGHIRRNEHGVHVVFWRPSSGTTIDPDTGEERKTRKLWPRVYTVFNVSQCEGLKLEGIDPPPTVPFQMSDIYVALEVGIVHGGDEACYNPVADRIQMPNPQAFSNEDAYATTGLHEVSHSTGHPRRLNRQFGARFGDHQYALEELIAELSSAYLCGRLGIDMQLEHHASYIQCWLRALGDHPDALVSAASRAQAAADYVLARMGIATDARESSLEWEADEAA
jgi:antirestriction protein ArdC